MSHSSSVLYNFPYDAYRFFNLESVGHGCVMQRSPARSDFYFAPRGYTQHLGTLLIIKTREWVFLGTW